MSDNISDYIVQYRTTVGPGSWQTFADPVSAIPGATVTGLTAGTSYDFQVAAVNDSGTGPYSNVVTVALPDGVNPIGGSSTSSSAVANISATATIDPTGCSSTTHAGTALITATKVKPGKGRTSTVGGRPRTTEAVK